MSRLKNAQTGYFVAPLVETGEPQYMELARFIQTVNDDSEENAEDIGYYDGDGTPEKDVVSIAEKYSFQGFYDDTDPAMRFIRGLKRKVGAERQIMFKKVESFGDVVKGVATVLDIKFTGGEATGYPAFSCTIAFNKMPTIVQQTEQ
jgi:hypothetical protein